METQDSMHVLAVFRVRDGGCDPDEGISQRDLKSNRRQSATGLTAIYRVTTYLCKSCFQKLQQGEMRGANEPSDLD